jgi:3-deoxy-D-arabino-heptulosonate 7-phosphate (DAHP) synthase
MFLAILVCLVALFLVDVPDFEDPISIESVDATTPLVANHVNYGVVLQRWSCSQIHRVLNHFLSGNVILCERVLTVHKHDLT